MICQEVMEYMQRELDGDLDDLEFAKAHEHIRQCPECSYMYERLKRLSAELESLPKVTPPFSLVDAILPKLDEIDRAQAAAIADDGASEIAAPAASAERTVPRRRNSRFSLRIVSGVVAAGVVAGIFFVTYDRDALDTSMSGSSAVMESASSGSSSSSMLMMADTTTSSTDAAEGWDNSDPIMQKSAKIGSVVDQHGSEKSSDSSESLNRPSSPDRVGDGGTDVGAGFGSGLGSSLGSDSGIGGEAGAEEDRMSPPNLLQGEDDGIAVAEEDFLETGPMMGIAGFAEETAEAPLESASPDGSWIAVFADSRVIVYDLDGNTRFEGEARQGAITAFGWTEDGAFFRYEVRKEDGTGEIYRIDPVEGTETREQ